MTQQSSTAGPCPTSGACEHPCTQGTTRREFGLIIGAIALLVLAGDGVAASVTLATGTQSGSDRAYPIPPADGVTIDRDAQVILVRASGHMYAFALSCPHQNAAVKWVAQGNRFQCTKHDSRYQVDGVHTAGRATRNLDRYPIRRVDNVVHVDVSRVFRSDADLAGWTAATLTLS
ncbi:MAG: Rieske (2Fe-2S) protein [Acidobacteriota bacterium]|nr:Rieske (2Fe-2S) protein [Acidobacteriota bacterium]